jgi:hypothetical protein
VTAKEKLRDVVEELSEAEAAVALDYIVGRRHSEPHMLTKPLAGAPASHGPTTPDAPVSHEPTTPEDRKRQPQHHALRAIAMIPSALFVGLFVSVYVAMAIVLVVVIVRGLT